MKEVFIKQKLLLITLILLILFNIQSVQAANSKYNLKLSEQNLQYVMKWSEFYDDFDYNFILAIMKIETGHTFNANLICNNDYGLMQINTVHHEHFKNIFGFSNVLDPYWNIKMGVCILNELNKIYQGDKHKIAIAYNMGQNGLKSLNNKGIYTTYYSRAVMKEYNKFKEGYYNNDKFQYTRLFYSQTYFYGNTYYVNLYNFNENILRYE